MAENKNLTVVSKGEVETRGNYSSVTVLMKENEGQYPAEIAVKFGGKTLENGKSLNVGDVIEEVKFGISSREYNGRYYTDLNGFFVKKAAGSKSPSFASTSDDSDSLPF